MPINYLIVSYMILMLNDFYVKLFL